MVWCAPTMMPGRQWMPLAGMRRRAWMATTDCPARSTAPARSLERDSSTPPDGVADDAAMGSPVCQPGRSVRSVLLAEECDAGQPVGIARMGEARSDNRVML